MKLKEENLYGTWVYSDSTRGISRIIIIADNRVILVGERTNAQGLRVPTTALCIDYVDCFISNQGKLYYQTRNLELNHLAVEIAATIGYLGTNSSNDISESTSFTLCGSTNELISSITVKTLVDSLLLMIGDKIIHNYKTVMSTLENNKEEVK